MQKLHKTQRLALAAAPRPLSIVQPHRGHGRAQLAQAVWLFSVFYWLSDYRTSFSRVGSPSAR